MGIPVLVLGKSGSGKTASLRNFAPDDIGIFNVASKPLPFKKKMNKYDKADYRLIISKLEENKLNTYVIDDSQYLMAFELFNRAKEAGYGKFTDIAVAFEGLIDYIINYTSKDTIVFFLHHSEVDDAGNTKAKTSGKMLDNQLTIEGLFSIVLMADTENGHYKFITQSDGYTTCKSPMDMFDLKIDNDLKFVDDTIRNYWGLAPRGKKKEAIKTNNKKEGEKK